MLRMRTIEQTAAYIREHDRDSALTATALRRLVTSNTLPSVKAGNKYLIALEVLEDFLSTGGAEIEPPAPSGTIRPIRE